MQSWWLDAGTDPPRMLLRDVDRPVPGAGQVLLRMRAVGLNRGEFIVGGLSKAGTAKPLGIEGAGEVVAAGPGANRYATGARVMGRFPGGLAEYAVANETDLLPLPDGLGWEAAGALPVTFMVAHDMVLLQGGLKPDDWLLVAGITSGVGVASLQIAHAIGARVIGTSRSADKLQKLQALGLDVAVCTSNADLYPAVMQATAGAGVALAINAIGGSVFAECMRCLAYEGRLATVGYVDGRLQAPLDLQALHAKRLVLFGVSNKMTTPQQKALAVRRFEQDLMPLVASGRLRPIVERTFGFDDALAARALMESDAHTGKIVVTMP
ncbi:MAG: zinc-binding alcohol dehydrogenase family protein [Ramlibacter sp.]